MRRRVNLPGQLPLNFDCSYLRWIDLKGENLESFQETAQKLFFASAREEESSPIWQEIICALKR